MAEITITTQSPERAWEPFLAWLREQGIDPNRCREVTVQSDLSAGSMVLFKHNLEGKKYIDPNTDDVAVEQHRFKPTSLPPRKVGY